MSWRDRAAPTPRPNKEREEQPLLWRDRQGQINSWREREVPVARSSPRTTLPPPVSVGAKPVSVENASRRAGLWRVEREAADAVKLTESERRAVQGRNMLDKLRRRISAPAEMQGSMKR
ncbi:hypothetical protein FRC07_013571, partial [Ceratobasidium sp. 392]